MKKEVDTWKLEQLFETFVNAMLWAWYLSGVIIGAVLWFFPLPQSNIQTFALAGAFVFWTLLSISISKVKQIKQELK